MVAATILFTILGIIVVSRVASDGKPNIHNSNTIVYLVGKVPFNVLTNVCGLQMWTNTHAKNNPEGFPNEPLFSFELPSWMPTGAMRQVGIYRIAPEIPLMTARFMLTLFGVMLSLVVLVIAWRHLRLVRGDGLPYVTQLSLLYGVLAFLLGPGIGASAGRLIAYGWPFAWIAAPDLLSRYFKLTKSLLSLLIVLQVLACWTPLVLRVVGIDNIPADSIAVIVALACQVLAFKSLNRARLADSDICPTVI